jgi:hypothetical protein
MGAFGALRFLLARREELVVQLGGESFTRPHFFTTITSQTRFSSWDLSGIAAPLLGAAKEKGHGRPISSRSSVRQRRAEKQLDTPTGACAERVVKGVIGVSFAQRKYARDSKALNEMGDPQFFTEQHTHRQERMLWFTFEQKPTIVYKFAS